MKEEKQAINRIEHLDKQYIVDKKPVDVLKDISLEIQEGEFITIVGHSGCGKSTLLRIISGLAEYEDGIVERNGHKVEGPGPQCGMAQRAAIARGLVNNPKILLLDEPFGALDAQTRYAMEQELRTIWEKEKRTVCFVTNNIEEAIYLGDRVVVMSALPGRVKTEYSIDIPSPRAYTHPIGHRNLDFPALGVSFLVSEVHDRPPRVFCA